MELKRSTAFKLRISDILEGLYVKTDGFTPNYLEINGIEVSKVNIIGTVIMKQSAEFKSITIDDGSGAIQLRFFEENPVFEKIAVGDAVTIIGKPREFMSGKYILPEILRKVDDERLIKLRQAELNLNKVFLKSNPEKNIVKTEYIVEDKAGPDGSYEKIFSVVRELDKGEGADFDSVLGLIGSNYDEASVRKLIEKGELFEVRPGRLKVL